MLAVMHDRIFPSDSVHDSLDPDEMMGFSMPPKKPKLPDNALFRMQLTNMIDMAHLLVNLAGLIDWSWFDEAVLQALEGEPVLPVLLRRAVLQPQAGA